MIPAHATTVILAKPLKCACGGDPSPIDGKQRVNGRWTAKTYLRCPLCFACGPMSETLLEAQRGWNGIRHAQAHTLSMIDELIEEDGG